MSHKLREANALLGQGQTISRMCAQLGITDQTDYRWRKACGGMKLDQAGRVEELEAENARLKHMVAVLTVDKLILEEMVEEVLGNILSGDGQ